MSGPRDTLLRRVATGFALLLSGWSGWTVLASFIAGSDRQISLWSVGVCLVSLLISALLLLTQIVTIRFRPSRTEAVVSHADTIPTDATGLSLAERLADRVALRFNNLLTPINGYCELLLESLSPEHPARVDIEEIRRAGEEAAALSRQLQSFGRSEDYSPYPLDLTAWILEREKTLRQLAGEWTNFVLELEASASTVRADPRQLCRIFAAITENARDAMPEGGELRVRMTEVQKGSASAYVLLEFIDTGCGIDAEAKERLFEPLFTTKLGGQGAGLSLTAVREAVRSLGGTIEVTSAPVKGTVFRIYLPRLLEPPAERMPQQARPETA